MSDKRATIYDLARMCKTIGDCYKCPMADYTTHRDQHSCIAVMVKGTNKANQIVVDWCDEHPRKTYLQDFKEKFPKARLAANGIPNGICIKDTYGLHLKCASKITCIDCWNRPMEGSDE